MALALQSLMGLIVLYAFAWIISEKRTVINWRTVFGAIILQVVLLLLLFKFPWFKEASSALNDALKVQSIEDLLAGFGGTARKTFIDFERQAKERLRIAGKYGFDLVALEAQNGKERAALLTATITSLK